MFHWSVNARAMAFGWAVSLVLTGAAVEACDTCHCKDLPDDEECEPSEVRTAQPAILNFTSYKAAGRAPSAGEAQASSSSSFKFAVVGDTQGLQFLEKLTAPT